MVRPSLGSSAACARGARDGRGVLVCCGGLRVATAAVAVEPGGGLVMYRERVVEGAGGDGPKCMYVFGRCYRVLC